MVAPEDIKAWIEAGLDESSVVCSGDGRHFDATIVSPAFEGLSMIQQHQLVYGVLGEKMKVDIHALSMKTMTPDQASN